MIHTMHETMSDDQRPSDRPTVRAGGRTGNYQYREGEGPGRDQVRAVDRIQRASSWRVHRLV